MSLRQLDVDLQEVVDAMTASHEDPYLFFLDLESGKVQTVHDEMDDLPDEEVDFEPDPDQHVEIPRNESRDDYDLMRRFAAAVDEDVAALLDVALQGKGAFARFRDVIHRQGLDQRWYTFKDEADRARAHEWLASLGIEGRDTSAPRTRTMEVVPTVRSVQLLDLLLLGGFDGKPDLVDGRVLRLVRASSRDDAQRWFRSLARELCQMSGVPWRKSLIEGKTELDIDRFHLRLDEDTVELRVVVSPDTLKMFW